MKKVELKLRSSPPPKYAIQIGAGAIASAPRWLKSFRTRRAFIIADERLIDARAALKATLHKGGWEVHEIAVSAGEKFKDIDSVYPLFGELLKNKANRDSVLFALGGGSIGDAAGFIASTYLRGIAWVGVPTTLLAQVDSSVGGKTGINHSVGKNLIGSFHQPALVICDTQFLKTLSPREIVSGFGEVVKYALTFDPAFFRWLEKNLEGFLSLKPKVLEKCIETSVRWKAKTVAPDELDRKGIREVLNFGHTFGHALESLTHYETFQHGEAVLWGMRFALCLSVVRGHLKPQENAKAQALLARVSLPPLPKGFRLSDFIDKMNQDKKIRDGKIHFVLLKRIGKSISDNRVTETDLEKAFQLLVKLDGDAS